MIPVGRALLGLFGASVLIVGAIYLIGLQEMVRIAPLATLVVATLGAVIAYAAIWWNRRIARLKATLDLIEGSESKEFYQARYRAFRDFRRATHEERNQIADPTDREHDDLRAKCQDFLNHYELVAIACRHGLIDEEFYRSWMGPTFVRDWNEASILVIRARRPDGPGDSGNSAAYAEFEELARRWGGVRLRRQ
jgi:Domain of unknown function (DUF4760)